MFLIYYTLRDETAVILVLGFVNRHVLKPGTPERNSRNETTGTTGTTETTGTKPPKRSERPEGNHRNCFGKKMVKNKIKNKSMNE